MDTHALTHAAGLVLDRAAHHGGGRGGGFGELLTTFVHSIVASLGWQAGKTIADFLGAWLIVLAVVAIGWWLLRNRKPRTRSRRTRRGKRR
ncbi:hypothetical protein ACFWY9_16520 [Amycolatopsis sp. NPDC059027]|uniref:hypothetical protein n=1 Tax=Amycolatopsis sp. NPDC059027 TaxID=3346709 RepID=UPI00367350C8